MKQFIIKHKVLWISITISALIIMLMASCRTGYGCKGRSKTKTGFREERFIGY